MEREIRVPEWAVRFADDFTGIDRFERPVDPATEPIITVTLPNDAYYEYGFFDESGTLRADPNASEAANNPWYPNLSAITGPEWKAGEFVSLDPASATGITDRERVPSAVLGEGRRIMVYTPAGYETAPLPTLYVQDGVAFYRIAKLHAVLEALLAEKRVQPARLVFIEPGDRPAEYGYNDQYVQFMAEELPRWLQQQYDVHPNAYYMGASLGGLASLLSVLANTANAKGLATFSGAFLGTPEHREFYRTNESWLLEHAHDVLPKLPKWFLQTGKLEWLYEVNKALARELATLGLPHKYVARSAGHNWGNWCHSLAPALEFLL